MKPSHFVFHILALIFLGMCLVSIILEASHPFLLRIP